MHEPKQPNKRGEFLERLRSGGPWVITAIEPDGPTLTITAKTIDQAFEFIKQYNGKKNLYYSVNPTRGPMDKKAKKTDIGAIEYLLADLDPKKDEPSVIAKARYLAALKDFKPKATAIIDSGNGIQVLWKLKVPIALPEGQDNSKAIAEVEAFSGQAMKVLGCEDTSTRNVDRILRIPFTINLPNEKKRKSGRVACETSLIDFNNLEYELSDFPKIVEEEKPKQSKAGRKPKKATFPKNLLTILTVPDPGTGNKCGAYKSRSDALFGFIRGAMRAGMDDADILAEMIDPEYSGCGVFEHIKENSGEGYARSQIEHALNVNDAQPVAKGKPPLIRVEKGSGKLSRAVDQTQAALIAAKRPIYYRGGFLVEPLFRWQKTAEANRDALIASFAKLNVARLRYMVDKHAAEYRKFNKRDKTWYPIDPPAEVMDMLLELGHWGFDTVRGIINSPTMRRDGSLVTEPGYDRETQLWLKTAGDVELPSISKRPTRKEAEAALQRLEDLLFGFPFVDGVSLSVALAGVMTTLLRGAFDHAPLFLFRAPESGTGKTYLIVVISTIATGRPPMAIVGCVNKEEMEKRITAAAFSAMPIVSVNNISFDLESDLLNQMVTEPTVGLRLFGTNDKLVECDCRGTTIFANGNNINVVGDLVRRSLIANLDAQMESPEDRQYDFDPIDLVKAKRGNYLADVFTIVRAFMTSREHIELKPFAGFDGWSRMVRAPLIWLGKDDPVKSKDESRAADPNRAGVRLRSVLLRTIFGSGTLAKPFNSVGIFNKAQETTSGGQYGYPKPRYPELDAVFRIGRDLTTRSIGNTLRKDVNKIVDGFKLVVHAHDPVHGHLYRIEGPDLAPEGSAQAEASSEM